MKLATSPHMRKIIHEENVLIYDAKTGKNLKINTDSLQVIELIQQGMSVEDIKNEFDAPQIDDLIAVLKEKGLVMEGIEAPPVLSPEKINEDYAKGKIVQHLRLNVTENCNLDCTYCYERVSNIYAKKRIMGWEVAKKAIDEFLAITKANQQKHISIRFFGGEPLLNWKVVKQSIDYAKSQVDEDTHLNFIINTNGTLLNQEIAKVLAENRVSIALSLDGVGDSHDKTRKYINGKGSFGVIDKNIDILAENQCQFNLSVVCTDNNYPYLHDLIDYLKEKQEKLRYRMAVNFNNIQICDRHGIINMPTEEKVKYLVDAIQYAQERGIYCYGGLTHFVFDKLIKGFVGRYCAGLGSEFSVDPEGNVFPCSGIQTKLGTIYELDKIFNSEEYKELISRTSGTIKECEGCEIEGFCAGGCFAELLSDSGKEKGAYRDCDLQKLTFTELVKLYVLT